MDYGIISTVVNILFIVSIAFGFLLGLIRGLKKSILRFVLILISAVAALLLTGRVVGIVLSFDISSFGATYNGVVVKNLNEYLTLLIQGQEGISPVVAEAILEIIATMANVLFGGIIFLVVYLLLKLITLPIFWIASIIISAVGKSSAKKSGEKYKRHRLLGSVVGALTGLLSFIIMFVPVTGYFNVANTLTSVIMEHSTEEELGDIKEFSKIFGAYEQSFASQFFKMTGINSLQNAIFKSVTTATVNDVSIDLISQAENAGNLVGAVQTLMAFDPETYFSEGSDITVEKFVNDILTLIDSDLLKASSEQIFKVVRAMLEEEFAKDPSMSQEEQRLVFDIVDDLENAVKIASNEQLRAFVTGVVDIVVMVEEIDHQENISPELLQSVGALLDDTIECNIIGRDTIEDIIKYAMTDGLKGLNAEYPATYEAIMQAFDSPDLSYERELTAIGKLLKLERLTDGLNIAESGVEIGKVLDEAIAVGATIVSKETVNVLFVEVVDSLIKTEEQEQGTETALYDLLVSVKQRLESNTVESYETEFRAIQELYGIVEIVNEENFDLAVSAGEIGAKIDSAIGCNAKLVSQGAIDDFLTIFIDGEMERLDPENPLYDSLARVKEGLNGQIQSYEVEFSAVGALCSISEILDRDFDYTTEVGDVGKIIDDTILMGAIIVDKQLINDLISVYLQEGISLGEQFGETVDNVTSRLHLEFSYQKEFEMLERLLLIAENVDKLGVEQLNNPFTWEGETQAMTIGERLDEVASSKLFGDCGLTFIGGALEGFADENPQFASITAELLSNYEAIKDNARVCGAEEGYTYVEVTDALYQSYHLITDESDKVTGNTEFTRDLANYYEEKLSLLQNNLIVSKNGARAIASFVMQEVKSILTEQRENTSLSGDKRIIFENAMDELILYADNYSKYLTAQMLSTESEPYNDSTNLFVTSESGGFDGQFTYHGEMPTTGKFVRVNKPFSFVYDLLDEIVNAQA